MKKLIEKLRKAVKKLRDKIKSALQPNMKPVALSYQVGGGMVNKWHLIAPTWVDELAAAGCGWAFIEFFPWASGIMNHEELSAAYLDIVTRCRQNDVKLFISLTNDNQGKGKYGDKLKPLGEYLPQIRAAAEWIKEVTRCDYRLQPVAENYGGGVAKQIENFCASIFPKSVLVSNGNAGRPSGAESWASLYAWHPTSIDQKTPRGAIIVSDTGAILSQLYGSKWQSGAPADVKLVEEWAHKCLADGAESVGLYDFGGTKSDPPAYRALASAAGVGYESGDKNENTSPVVPPSSADALDLSGVAWDGLDISAWPITTDLQASRNGNTVNLINTGISRWPDAGKRAKDGRIVTGNAWVIANIGGRWRAATWEWLVRGQQSKAASSVAGDHVKKSAWPTSWKPSSGEKIYLAVSGLCRDNTRNVSERSQFVEVIW